MEAMGEGQGLEGDAACSQQGLWRPSQEAPGRWSSQEGQEHRGCQEEGACAHQRHLQQGDFHKINLSARAHVFPYFPS